MAQGWDGFRVGIALCLVHSASVFTLILALILDVLMCKAVVNWIWDCV